MEDQFPAYDCLNDRTYVERVIKKKKKLRNPCEETLDFSTCSCENGDFGRFREAFLDDLDDYRSKLHRFNVHLELITRFFERGYVCQDLIQKRNASLISSTKTPRSVIEKELKNELKALDCLITYIAHPFFCLLLSINRKKIFVNDPRIPFILNGIFRFGSEKTLKKIMKKSIWTLIKVNVATNCGTAKKFFMAPLLALIEKLPAKSVVKVLTPKILLTLRNSTKDRELAELCSYVIQKGPNVIRKKNYLELFIAGHFSAFDRFDLACSRLRGGSLEVNLVIVADLIGEGLISTDEIIASNFVNIIFHVLTTLESPSRDQNVKAFLKAFVVRKDKDSNKLDSRRFGMLIHLLQEVAAEVAENDLQTKLFPCSDCMNGRCGFEWNKDMVYMTFKVLFNLYCLNKHWYQWFDEVRAPCVMSARRFEIWSHEVVAEKCQTLEKLEHFRYIAKLCPPVFSFKTRVEFMKHNICKLHPQDNPSKTFEVSRNTTLKDVKRLFKSYHSDYRWDYYFEGEIGRGAGPTKEFYSILSRDFQIYDLNLWLGEAVKTPGLDFPDETSGMTFTYSPKDLFPKLNQAEDAGRVYEHFELLGKTVAKCLMDGHMLEIPISVEFIKASRFRYLFERKYYYLHKVLPLSEEFLDSFISIKRRKAAIESDSTLNYEEKQKKIEDLTFDDGTSLEDLCMDFTVPGQPDITLMEGGENVLLSPSNVDDYLEKLGSLVMKDGHKEKCFSFLNGFDSVLAHTILNMFLPEEIQLLVCGEPVEAWTVDYLRSYCAYLDEASYESLAAEYLLEVLANLNDTEKRLFLKFVCSQTRLPCGGLRGLQPPLTIACSNADDADHRLPWAATCFNRIHIPNYSSLEVTKERLLFALNECWDNFQIV